MDRNINEKGVGGGMEKKGIGVVGGVVIGVVFLVLLGIVTSNFVLFGGDVRLGGRPAPGEPVGPGSAGTPCVDCKDPPGDFCDDEECDGEEEFLNCPDGGDCCGNDFCAYYENEETCPLDCGCDEDGECDGERNEDEENCPSDCGCDEDGICEPVRNENIDNCPSDCECNGDGICNTEIYEDEENCPSDCGCDFDGICEQERTEHDSNCPSDCGCDEDGECELGRGETKANCPSDCGCGDGVCDPHEGGGIFTSYCYVDCCNNGQCDGLADGALCGDPACGDCAGCEEACECEYLCEPDFPPGCEPNQQHYNQCATSCDSPLICPFGDSTDPNANFWCCVWYDCFGDDGSIDPVCVAVCAANFAYYAPDSLGQPETSDPFSLCDSGMEQGECEECCVGAYGICVVQGDDNCDTRLENCMVGCLG
jgi:hypothetical protein